MRGAETHIGECAVSRMETIINERESCWVGFDAAEKSRDFVLFICLLRLIFAAGKVNTVNSRSQRVSKAKPLCDSL